ncbi:MAG TPA: UDP-3-O-(3-hydroxymyristoyl)glucosamine N-acyltransferase [Beijerinckiaceae bacterium]|nr:UDP-3-O-(3-hydroxymyristoyl)glucosamine N-acyltransferase [Beijerinckiaceae bacterium]
MTSGSVLQASVTLSLADVAAIAQADLPGGADPTVVVRGAAPLEDAGPADVAYVESGKYAEALAHTRAGVCLVPARFRDAVPAGAVALVCKQPHLAFARVMTRLYPEAARPSSSFAEGGISPHALVHPTAQIADGVMVDPGAIVGPGAQIGAGSRIGAYSVVGPDVRIGRDCALAAQVNVIHAVLGDRVVLHPGVRIGQDGFGFVMTPQGHTKVPQLGRVIIGDDVEIGANCTIDRGSSRDTIIGEGTKMDNMVHVAHNVVIGKHCVLVAQVGIAGSTVLEDFVAVGGQTAIAPHLRLGAGVQIAADAGVMTDVPARGKWGGSPARPMRHFFREYHTLRKLARTDESGAE